MNYSKIIYITNAALDIKEFCKEFREEHYEKEKCKKCPFWKERQGCLFYSNPAFWEIENDK